ncbi:hypothetical protein PSACC_01506 [Paramicrosporidium saccamoebae]|uniref:Uncharacterized protein n=1 Tax=Paramicrosporidium saccamoebae TaxID=1246581 RepID=A0A2H9TLR0_9FUNG|nr:hypothetical protein PSACC_01506 [Paramicrosporidium saccamoebae]
MKYGRNQWARISSLLVRKTPKQCKARWNEWLDPRIKKTEWSKEEDEKLLHLAKVFPSQWGTISDLVGRTSQMCLERYERLLDAAQNEEGEGAGTTLSEARKLRPGEIDPSPETKAARPDPIDMDEDEKEMLAEARARLANTQGKKAKRKAREKLLDEARRAAALQKRKELIVAGLPGIAVKQTGMDYNNEIPFERKPQPGLYDPTEELEGERRNHEEQSRTRQKIGPTKEAIELAERRKDVQKQKERVEKGHLPAALERKLREQQAARRVPLSLPAPQIGDVELEQIAKIGYASEAARLAAEESATPAASTLRPNVAMTPLSHRGGSYGGATPMSSTMSVTTVGRTPLRDQLGINASIRQHEPLDSASMLDAFNKNRLREAFKSLPKPKNDFDIVVPEE